MSADWEPTFASWAQPPGRWVPGIPFHQLRTKLPADCLSEEERTGTYHHPTLSVPDCMSRSVSRFAAWRRPRQENRTGSKPKDEGKRPEEADAVIMLGEGKRGSTP